MGRKTEVVRETETGSSAGHTQGENTWVRTPDGRELHAMVLPGPDQAQAPTIVFESGAGGEPFALGAGAAAGRGMGACDRLRPLRLRPQCAGPAFANPGQDRLNHFGPGPYVLVGHSAGGPIVRAAAAANPQRIVGLVLVDPTEEGQDVLFNPVVRWLEKVGLAALRLAARLRVLPWFYRSTVTPLPPDAQQDMRREAFTLQAMRTFRAAAHESRRTGRIPGQPTGFGRSSGHRDLGGARWSRCACFAASGAQRTACAAGGTISARPPRRRRTLPPLRSAVRTGSGRRRDPPGGLERSSGSTLILP